MDEIFYRKGLKFECQRCSKCCRHDPGYVFLSEEDLEKIIKRYSHDRKEFIDKFCTDVDINGFKRLSLKEKSNYDCIFWEDGGCKIYDVRPFQCISYPFWPAHLFSKSSWDDVENDCPGINKGPVHDYNEIKNWLKKREQQKFIIIDNEVKNYES